jgi:hypothetical protein
MPPSVMAGLVPAIHVFAHHNLKDVDARHKAGHDDWLGNSLRGIPGGVSANPE